eukprot:INCI1701.1.p1 GENE.INCI1701.1~~INCI1701.1.p1  ORF type:complete len:206 (-),score=31.14 INCI1701.1:102-719(-)
MSAKEGSSAGGNATKNVLRAWEAAHGSPSSAKVVKINAQNPPLTKLDDKILNAVLTNCLQLSFSTNAIEKMPQLRLPNLRILSLGRNCIKKLELKGLEPTLEQLWLSYNEIDKLDGIENMRNLCVLYMSNNKISKWGELSKLAHLPELDELILFGNPIYSECPDLATARVEVLKRVPQISKLDNRLVTPLEREQAKAPAAGGADK